MCVFMAASIGGRSELPRVEPDRTAVAKRHPMVPAYGTADMHDVLRFAACPSVQYLVGWPWERGWFCTMKSCR
ncbi:hypothetical protein TOPH_02254 [Tolypocladium ophioglossoides CBS 100239]|uniref:Uncharacterized protein n=1 Tax=Tolypocladium ophioglossoides (strain CBS 100239) TaxID=1163406 RepID=A0A0L0NGU9_TOLOC|nr:hypothetical protein TOPH_02254 [Tolypocladium ophioglossoides CBS 100239]